jgi:hypothetical protein
MIGTENPATLFEAVPASVIPVDRCTLNYGK